MIRINLLPIGKRPVEDRIRKEISFFFLLIFLSLVVMAYFHVGHTREIKRITDEKIDLDKDIRRYQARQKQLDEIKKQTKIIKQKLTIIKINFIKPKNILNTYTTKIQINKTKTTAMTMASTYSRRTLLRFVLDSVSTSSLLVSSRWLMV